MKKGTKRKAKQQQEAKQDAAEDNTTKPQPRAKRARSSKPQSEPEYFEDKRNLVSEQLHLHHRFNAFISIRTVSSTEHSQEWDETNLFVCSEETIFSVLCLSRVFVSVLVRYANCLAWKWLC